MILRGRTFHIFCGVNLLCTHTHTHNSYGKMMHTPSSSLSSTSTASQDENFVATTISSFEMFQTLCKDKSSVLSSWFNLIMSPSDSMSSSSKSIISKTTPIMGTLFERVFERVFERLSVRARSARISLSLFTYS